MTSSAFTINNPTFQLTTIQRPGRIGIIDIGSNSIRLVVYDQQKRCPVPIYNEKVMCALGKGLATTGMLNPDGKELARSAMRRFVAMARHMDIASLYVMATAAIRDAKDGAHFAAELETSYQISIDIISGEREAMLGAYGICSSIYQPSGISGDLGGGSMELVHFDKGHIGERVSVPLGSLRMVDESKGDRAKIRKMIESCFSRLSWLEGKKTDNFYAIGGSFRALAKMHLTANNYPLHVLHEYSVPSAEFAKFATAISEMSTDKLEKFPGVAPKRINALPGAALILDRIIKHTQPEHIVFSASGIREGYIYEKLSAELRQHDGLIASCKDYASRGGRSDAYARELYQWMTPLFSHESEGHKRLRQAACLLSDIALLIHPEYRAEWAYHRILYSALTSLTHRERVMLGVSLFYRYEYKGKADWPAMKLLTPEDIRWARLIGVSANLAYHLSGSIAGNLHNAELHTKGKSVELELTDSMRDVMGDAVKRRLDMVSDAYKAMIGK